MTTWRMLIACWITEATNTYPEYANLIAFPLQQWLHDGSSMLRYTSTVYVFISQSGISCLVFPKKRSVFSLRYGQSLYVIYYCSSDVQIRFSVA